MLAAKRKVNTARTDKGLPRIEENAFTKVGALDGSQGKIHAVEYILKGGKQMAYP